jgi:predicted thioesterase
MPKSDIICALPELKPGLTKTLQKALQQSDMLSIGHGALTELMATPTLSALLIEASVSAVDPLLPAGYVTIGLSTYVNYLNATFIGMTVTVVATLVAIKGRRLTFEIIAFDEIGEVGRGKHERHIVNAENFMQSAYKRCEPVRTMIK